MYRECSLRDFTISSIPVSWRQLRHLRKLSCQAGSSHAPMSKAEARDIIKEAQSPSLIAASQSGLIGVVRAWLVSGVDLEARGENGDTALHYASRKGYLEVVRELLAAGADTSARNKVGKTPLHMASDGSHLEVYQELMASGADIEAKDMFD